MANTKYEEELEKAKLQQQQAQQQSQQQSQQKAGLLGVSDSTRQNLGALAQGYTPSQNVTAAQEYLKGLASKRPGDYSSQYAPQITQLYDKMMNRGQFKYDMDADPLWQQYKNSYMQTGRQAMQDTVGTMAALTGGYGNSYAQAAGQQQYQQYLLGLHDQLPALQQQAFARYQQEGQDIQNQLSIAQALDDTAYGRYRDALGEWKNERNYAKSAYESEYEREYNDYLNRLNYWQQQGQLENQDYWKGQEYGLSREQMEITKGQFEMQRRSDAFERALTMLQLGMTPGADLLAVAGLTDADVKAYLALRQGTGGGGGGNGAGKETNRSMGRATWLKNTAYALAAAGVSPGDNVEAAGMPKGTYQAYLDGRKDWMVLDPQEYEKKKQENSTGWTGGGTELKKQTRLTDTLGAIKSIATKRTFDNAMNQTTEQDYENAYAELLKEKKKGK